MASAGLLGGTVHEATHGSSERESNSNDVKSKAKDGNGKEKSRKFSYFSKLGCFRIENVKEGNFDMEVETNGEPANPTHLVVMVNGICGSAENWKFAAKQFLKRYPLDVIIHCSKANTSTLTFDGIDVMGRRLAEEVVTVIKLHPSAQKISFIAHSLGGLISRYAIAELYELDLTKDCSLGNGNRIGDACVKEKFKGRIAGLEPINFITSATPHLGSRWHKQVPMLGGFYSMEKAAAHISWFFGRTGKHLFLTDGDNGKPPLLLQMISDSEQLKFISALQSFKCCVAYANVHCDHIVGWSTSSLRHRNELPKKKHLLRDEKYPHIVHVKTSKTAGPQQEVPLEAKVDGKTVAMEEEMIKGLTKVSWERVDVSFRGSKQRFMAHTTIQVQRYRLHSDGADVIQHMIDNFVL